jgi:hypothetical protein
LSTEASPVNRSSNTYFFFDSPPKPPMDRSMKPAPGISPMNTPLGYDLIMITHDPVHLKQRLTTARIRARCE